jgi:hypothetical protein
LASSIEQERQAGSAEFKNFISPKDKGGQRIKQPIKLQKIRVRF